MRFILVIAILLLFAEYSNLDQLFNLTEETVVFCIDPESEEENKSEKEDFKKFKGEKHHYNFDFASLYIFIGEQKKYHHKSGLCLKGHCALIDQPPEA
jgi:hypothetical protein